MGDDFEFTGGCLCGAVRYECTEPPLSAGTCHCRECQQWTGSAYNAFVGFPTSALRFTKGKPKIFNAPSGIKELGFCSDCGSPLWDRYFVRISCIKIIFSSLFVTASIAVLNASTFLS